MSATTRGGTRTDGAPLLEITNLRVEFGTDSGTVHAVNGVTLSVRPGEIVAVVGESGSGKTVTAMSIAGLIDQPPGRILQGTIMFGGRDLLTLSDRHMRKIRGKDIGVVFQDPMTALNPTSRIGTQIREALQLHEKLSRRQADERAVELLELVGVPEPRARLRQFPHEFSGGMRQRVVIAIAIANNPALLIADEPTTALDVTIQAQVLALLHKAQRETHAATILITHDLGVVAEMAERVVVMYAGEVVEQANVHTIFSRPRHPYTAGMLASLPRLDRDEDELLPIPGSPPNLAQPPRGCPFAPRCSLSQGRSRCVEERPALTVLADGHQTACHFHDEMEERLPRLSPSAEGAST